MTVLNLYNSKADRDDAVESGNLDKTQHEILHFNIGLCFRKKVVDIPSNINFSINEESLLRQSSDSIYYSNIDDSEETYISTRSDSGYTVSFIPIVSTLNVTEREATSLFKLR